MKLLKTSLLLAFCATSLTAYALPVYHWYITGTPSTNGTTPTTYYSNVTSGASASADLYIGTNSGVASASLAGSGGLLITVGTPEEGEGGGGVGYANAFSGGTGDIEFPGTPNDGNRITIMSSLDVTNYLRAEAQSFYVFAMSVSNFAGVFASNQIAGSGSLGYNSGEFCIHAFGTIGESNTLCISPIVSSDHYTNTSFSFSAFYLDPCGVDGWNGGVNYFAQYSGILQGQVSYTPEGLSSCYGYSMGMGVKGTAACYAIFPAGESSGCQTWASYSGVISLSISLSQSAD